MSSLSSQLHRITHGVVGILMSLAPNRRAVQSEVDRRRRACRACPYNSRNAVSLDIYTRPKRNDEKPGGRCESCGCFIIPKTALNAERCPEGKW